MDASLESLARRLRFLGYDVIRLAGARLEEVVAVARREDRTVLTLSARRPRRWADVPAITVARGDEAGAVRKLAGSCGKRYREGTHVTRIREWLEHALGRPLAPPGGTSGPG